MSKFEDILKKYEEFSLYLQQVETNHLKEGYSRVELGEFRDSLHKIKLRNLSSEVGTIMDEMKKEEFPELLGVHHYPDLRDIDFMSEENKKKLDKHLCMMRVGDYVYNLFRYTNDSKKLKSFLLERKIIEKVYFLKCPHHYNERLMGPLTEDELTTIKEALQKQDVAFLETLYEETFCNQCDDTADYSEWKDSYIQEEFRKRKDRDSTLDDK